MPRYAFACHESNSGQRSNEVAETGLRPIASSHDRTGGERIRKVANGSRKLRIYAVKRVQRSFRLTPRATPRVRGPLGLRLNNIIPAFVLSTSGWYKERSVCSNGYGIRGFIKNTNSREAIQKCRSLSLDRLPTLVGLEGNWLHCGSGMCERRTGGPTIRWYVC